jgi:hypothetical protein
MPRGVPHTFANLGGEPARMLGLAVPGGIEDLLASVPRDGNPGDQAQLAALAQKFGSRVMGPPLPLDHTAADRAASLKPTSPSR